MSFFINQTSNFFNGCQIELMRNPVSSSCFSALSVLTFVFRKSSISSISFRHFSSSSMGKPLIICTSRISSSRFISMLPLFQLTSKPTSTSAFIDTMVSVPLGPRIVPSLLMNSWAWTSLSNATDTSMGTTPSKSSSLFTSRTLFVAPESSNPFLPLDVALLILIVFTLASSLFFNEVITSSRSSP